MHGARMLEETTYESRDSVGLPPQPQQLPLSTHFSGPAPFSQNTEHMIASLKGTVKPGAQHRGKTTKNPAPVLPQLPIVAHVQNK